MIPFSVVVAIITLKWYISHHFLPFYAGLVVFFYTVKKMDIRRHGMGWRWYWFYCSSYSQLLTILLDLPQHAAPGPTSSLHTENHRAQILSAATGIKIFQCKKLKLFVTSMKETGSTKWDWETCLLSAVCLQLRTRYFWWKASAQLLYLFPDVQTRPNVDLKSFFFQELIMIW